MLEASTTRARTGGERAALLGEVLDGIRENLIAGSQALGRS